MNTRAIDNKNLRISDIDFNFVATNSGAVANNNNNSKDKYVLNPDRALIRYKYM